METYVNNLGTLGPLATAKAYFYRNAEEDAYGRIRTSTEPYLSDVPCMPPTGRNTRQDGIIFVVQEGSLPYETKWSAFDLTEDTRGQVHEQDRVVIKKYTRANVLLYEGDYIVAGVTEYDDPELGFAYAVLSLKDVAGD